MFRSIDGTETPRPAQDWTEEELPFSEAPVSGEWHHDGTPLQKEPEEPHGVAYYIGYSALCLLAGFVLILMAMCLVKIIQLVAVWFGWL